MRHTVFVWHMERDSGSQPSGVLSLIIRLVINAAMLALTAWIAGLFDLDVRVDGFWAAFLGALLISFVSLLLSTFVGRPLKRALR